MFGQGQGLLLKAKAKAKAKDSKFVLEDSSRPRTKAKDNNTDIFIPDRTISNSLTDMMIIN